jgi:hypothetical protein
LKDSTDIDLANKLSTATSITGLPFCKNLENQPVCCKLKGF